MELLELKKYEAVSVTNVKKSDDRRCHALSKHESIYKGKIIPTSLPECRRGWLWNDG